MKFISRCILVLGFSLSSSVFADDRAAVVGVKETAASEPDYSALKAELLAIHAMDQRYRLQLAEMETTPGRNSPKMNALWKAMRETDTADLIKVEAILAQYGWLGPEQVGPKASGALFLVIQHSPLGTQQKYLPMMRSAVERGQATRSSLALLEDRVALGEGRPQLYGSQVMQDGISGNYHVRPLLDPDHVDERRASMGLGPLAEYVKRWGIVWDVEAYKAQLPELLAQLRPQQPPVAIKP